MIHLISLLLLLELRFMYFLRPIPYENIFAVTPFILPDNVIVFPSKDKLFVVPGHSVFDVVEIDVQGEPISEIVKIGNDRFAFCTDRSELIVMSKYGIESRVETEFPCIVPPIRFENKIWVVDLRGNLCLVEEGVQSEDRNTRCFTLDEESVKFTPEIINFIVPKMKVFQGDLLVAYKNKVFVLSDFSKYQLLELPGISISSLEIKGKYLAVTTEDTLYLFEIWKSGGVVEYRKVFERVMGNISGIDFDGENIAVSTADGLWMVNIKKFIKTVKIVGLFDSSNPVLYGNYVVFAGSFGNYLKSILPYKNSLILARFEVSGNRYKISLKEEKIIASFPKRIRRFGGKISFIASDGTLYLFSLPPLLIPPSR